MLSCERANQDLVRLAEFVHAESTYERARAVVLELRRRFQLLAAMPWAGHARSDLTRNSALRFWSVHPYLVAYLADRRPLFIVRILHGARAPDELRGELRDS